MDENILHSIKRLDKLIIREFLAKDDFGAPPTPTQMLIINYLLNHEDEDVYQKDLEEILNLRRATVSGVLQTMERNSLIIRKVSINDARVKQIILQSDAKDRFLSGKKLIDTLNREIKRDLSDDEIKEFLRIINKMYDNIIKYSLDTKKERKGLC